ncbi:hypothetical protein CAP35_02445 [Chitinophagaceae bacterium IBVUCB1]|nr:hypothetical protein CAP35_02445 [Chitinophagaceae bacterium IBVUCB1]
MSLQYRPEIDGLRAIAVVSVILFHLQVAPFTGGYVGVDVFFVISGYLITSIILQGHRQGRFTLLDFYKRRIRRIIPLTVAVYAIVLAICYFLFFEKQYASINHVVKSSLVFVSNFLLLRKKGYFDPGMQENPLLHTWSLSVEEQFYIIFPLTMLLLLRYGGSKWWRWLVLLALASFTANIIVTTWNAQKAYYWPHTRAWQLLAGALLATGIWKDAKTKPTGNLLSLVGLSLLLFTVLFYQDGITYPGLRAILPVAGAVLLIHRAKQGTYVYRLLSAKPVVYTGKISYSLYMWHWPVWVFAVFFSVGPVSPLQKLLLIVFVFLLSALSYRFIEQPFRTKRAASNPYIPWAILGSSATLMVCALLFIDNKDGICRKEYAAYQSQLNAYGDKVWEDISELEQRNIEDYKQLKPYRTGSDTAKPSFILWGDSHARSLAPGLDSLGRATCFSGYVLSAPLSPPLSGIRYQDDKRQLSTFSQSALEFINTHPEINTIILTARWPRYYREPYLAAEKFRDVRDAGILKWLQHDNEQQILFRKGLMTTLNELNKLGREVFITAPLPELKTSVNEMLVIEKLQGMTHNHFIASTDEYNADNNALLKFFSSISRHANILPIGTDLLNDTAFLYNMRTTPVYRDKTHLSAIGSRIATAHLLKYIR